MAAANTEPRINEVTKTAAKEKYLNFLLRAGLFDLSKGFRPHFSNQTDKLLLSS